MTTEGNYTFDQYGNIDLMPEVRNELNSTHQRCPVEEYQEWEEFTKDAINQQEQEDTDLTDEQRKALLWAEYEYQIRMLEAAESEEPF